MADTAVPPILEDSLLEVAAPAFQSLGLSEDVLKAVAALGLKEPTEIQAIGVPQVLAGGDVLLASQTGSGKTLSYLLPLIHQLRAEEGEGGVVARPKRPRAVVLLPTRELSHQILAVCKSICHHARFRSTLITGGDKWKDQKEALARPQDLVVATPGRLLQHVDEGNVFLGDVRYLVLDEADTMFDAGFGKEIRRVISPMRRHPKKQCVMVAATMSKAVRQLIQEELPDMRDVEASSLHHAAQNCSHDFVRVPGTDNKLEHLRQAIERDVRRQQQLMIFCNTVQSCRAVEHSLAENDIPTLCYHGDMPQEQRAENFKAFLCKPDALAATADGQLALRPVLVCTDLAARGLDVGVGGVDHVVNFDFPKNPTDYMHRTGRTARAGASGKVTSLVGKRDETIAYQLHTQISSGGSLDAVAKNKFELDHRRKVEHRKNTEAAKKRAFKESRRELRTGARNSRSGPGRTMATGMGKKVAVGTGGRPKKAKPVDTTSKKIRDRGGRR
eukprot:CAMPEP_0114244080 /NCGR_PEP_ID=MMETSP0058-20121206/11141_1 /TAXON_ID=36894 /ORGANISM="Pyramimonas parkeae, CCMP726" /LENGTH=500 /DNA_ID=CAMNT_0001356981 /DNA_START=420 /DNA_END=1923 /DNA_ORIENTATION=-